MSDVPLLPQNISSDGSEIWDWAAKASDHIHRQAKIRELRSRIGDLGRACGSCSKWMLPSCPLEKPDNRAGRSRGPHMNYPKCEQFTMSWPSQKVKDELLAELNVLEER
jgi:hypothetical protein